MNGKNSKLFQTEPRELNNFSFPLLISRKTIFNCLDNNKPKSTRSVVLEELSTTNTLETDVEIVSSPVTTQFEVHKRQIRLKKIDFCF